MCCASDALINPGGRSNLGFGIDKGTAVNWSLGLLRLWIVFTILWVGWAAFALYSEYPPSKPNLVQSTASPSQDEEGDYIVFYPNPKMEEFKKKVPTALAWAIGVPASVFITGFTLLWFPRSTLYD